MLIHNIALLKIDPTAFPAQALLTDDPRELLELVRPLERPLTEELLLAKNTSQM
jgi:hypothetical protein